MTTVRTLALIESATHLLNVVEWAHATGGGDGLRVAVLQPRDSHPRRQIAHIASLAAAEGIDVQLLEMRSAGVGAVSGGFRLLQELPRAERLIVGDPFSRMIQTLLPLCRANDVVILDDGTATWEFNACVLAGAPLIRWDKPHDRSAARAIRATRLLSPSDARQITMFTCLENATPDRAHSIANDYGWTRARSRPEVRTDEVDIVGSSLVETGNVDRRAYHEAVSLLARRYGPVRYIAHRRESDNRLAEISAIPGVRVERPRMPVELELRNGPVARHVITFPSTAAHTLPIVLSDIGVRIEVRHIEPGWFTPASTLHARRFVARIADDAHLEPVPVSA